MSHAIGFELFHTPIGPCAMLWSERGVRGLHLPGASAEAMRARLQQRHPGAHEGVAPPAVREAIVRVIGLLDGSADDLADIVLDLDDQPDFNRRVYELARGIAPGRTRTYGEVAQQLGDVAAARAVGAALGSNPIAIIVPCHRVLAAGGRSGGFSAPGGVDTKLKLLEIEQARIGDQPTLF
jgi:methylated-DNA-[protein]-cysteine S-methyltransferase